MVVKECVAFVCIKKNKRSLFYYLNVYKNKPGAMVQWLAHRSLNPETRVQISVGP